MVGEGTQPRLCTVRKWADFPGYGFNLHAERGRAGQYIGKVDQDSPAQAAGMKEGDRIVEINGVNIGNENHGQVVARIKASGDYVTMLLVDSDTDKYFKEQKVVISSELDEVLRMETPPRPTEGDQDNDTPPPPPDSEPPAYDEEEQREPTPEPPEQEREPTPPPVVIPAMSHDYYPRLCYIKKWPDFQGYGFNLHAEKDKEGQYIGAVDDDSPAESAGLKSKDRIIEVNGVNIEDETHQQVIQRIKAGGDETKLLVVDLDADNFFKNNGIRIHSSMEEVKFLETPPREAKASRVTPKMTYHPRECHLVKWPDFNGYGFNLHAEKERGAQFIGKVDNSSPAEEAGVREQDRIIAVNGVNVENETHQQVIARIKAGGEETRLLVVDKETDQYYKSKGITVTTALPEVKFQQASRRSPRPGAPTVANGDPTPAPQPTRVKSKNKRAPTPPSSPEELVFNMSAVEMRTQIVQRKRSDKRVNRTSMTEKLNIFEAL